MRTGLAVLLSAITVTAMETRFEVKPRPEQQVPVARDMQKVLKEELELWYPLSMDTIHGGFFSDINYRWELDGRQDKMIVTQARHVWAASNAARFFGNDRKLLGVAEHGFEFLRNTMWDNELGGFYDLVTREGRPIPEDGRVLKRAYGNAFAIYGLAAYYAASGDTAALKLAGQAFAWLEKNSRDPNYDGYFQFMARDGTPYVDGYDGTPSKDYNSMIHLLECYTELYKVWPDSLLKERLIALLGILRDTFTTPAGYLILYFNRDWSPVSFRNASLQERERNYHLDHVSFGHDVETAYLLLDASEVLGVRHDPTTARVAKILVDHAIRYGWDAERGGIYDGGYYLPGQDCPTIVRNTKEWWGQVEAFHSFLLMSRLYPRDEVNYYEMFTKQWEYCRKYVIDNEHGGWYWGGTDIVPSNRTSVKGSIWKGNYHTSRALINCIQMLQAEKD